MTQPPGPQQPEPYPSGPQQPEPYPSGPQPESSPAGQHPTSYPPPAPGGYGYGDERQAPSRPGTLIAGCVMTWVGSALGILGGLLLIVGSTSDDLLDEFAASDMSRSDAQAVLQFTGGIVLVWSLLAAVFAVFVIMGKRWAAIVLAVLGGLFAALGLYGVVSGGGAGSLVPVVWVIAACALIFAGSSDWFAFKSGKR